MDEENAFGPIIEGCDLVGWTVGTRRFVKPKKLKEFRTWKFDFDCDEKGMIIRWFGSNVPFTILSSGRKDWLWVEVSDEA